MREILFRGFHPDENGTEKVFVNGEWIKGFWVYGDLVHDVRINNDWCFMKGHSIVKLGEYKTIDMSDDYKQGHFGFYLEHIDKFELKTARNDILFYANNCEIIGSVHSNPELLEVGE